MAADTTLGSPPRRCRPLGSCPGSPAATKGLVFRPAGFCAFFFSGAATKQSRNHFPSRQGGFSCLGPAVPSQPPQNAVPISSMGTAQEVGPLTSSPPSQGQSWGGGSLWRAVYAPGDNQTSPAYSSQLVQYLYLNQLLSINKLVLLYLLLCLLPQPLI
jgi:hypothetical protein